MDSGEPAKIEHKPLRQMAEAFIKLAALLDEDLPLAPFSQASSLVSILFGYLGIAFKFAERDYVAKVRDLSEASRVIKTLKALLDLDLRNNTVKDGGSHSRNLLRVKRGLDMVRVLFQHLLETNGNSLKDPASRAYAQVFAPYHSLPIRAAVAAGLYTLPTRAQLLKKLNEDEDSAREPLQDFITAVASVTEYVDNLFISKKVGIDW